jgi:hypothetical protein
MVVCAPAAAGAGDRQLEWSSGNRLVLAGLKKNESQIVDWEFHGDGKEGHDSLSRANWRLNWRRLFWVLLILSLVKPMWDLAKLLDKEKGVSGFVTPDAVVRQLIDSVNAADDATTLIWRKLLALVLFEGSTKNEAFDALAVTKRSEQHRIWRGATRAYESARKAFVDAVPSCATP